MKDDEEFWAFRELSPRILRRAHAGLPLPDFLREALPLVLDASGWQTLELWLPEPPRVVHCRIRSKNRASVHISLQRFVADGNETDHPPVGLLRSGDFFRRAARLAGLPLLCALNRHETTEAGWEVTPPPPILRHYLPDSWRLAALVPLTAGESAGMCLFLDSRRLGSRAREFTRLVHATQILGGALADRAAQASLRERVKELTCLYEISRLSQQPDMELDDLLQRVSAMYSAWLIPGEAQARIVLDNRDLQTDGFRPATQRLTAAIVVSGKKRGFVEVSYVVRQPHQDEGPFLVEERKLLDTVARQIALIIESRHSLEERFRLQEQLRHADRLATLGQLSAGIAHELNEPLASILGFAQLIQQGNELPQQVRADIEKVVKASLHAREVVRKLLLFSRQIPTRTSLTDLNKTVDEGIYFLESRCTKENIVLEKQVDPSLPLIVADSSQLHQVLVNLVVNAVQAMNGGGRGSPLHGAPPQSAWR